MLPNFLIIGAAKCGTTALYYYLNQHPEISFPKLKEPKFFSSTGETFPHNGVGDMSVDKYAVKSFEKYQKLFSKIKSKTMVWNRTGIFFSRSKNKICFRY